MRGTIYLHLWITIVVDDGIRHTLGLHLALLIGLAHETLDRIDCILRVGNGLALSWVTHLALAVLHEANHGWRGALALRVSNHYRLVALEYGYAAVGST